MFELRPYQQDDVDFYLSCPDRGRVPIHCSPTGSGKTIIQAFIAKAEMDAGRPTAILTPRFEIFEQTHKALEEICGYGNVGLLRAGERWNRAKPVHVVSWPTLTKRLSKSRAWLPDVAAVLVDEAHLSVAPKIMEALKLFVPRAKVHGYTATPARKSGRGLGAIYTDIKHVTSVRQLLAQDYLTPLEYWAGSYADIAGLKISNGDYETKGLSERSVQLVGDVLDNWLRLASDRKTLGFAVDVPHAEALCDRFLRVGITADVVHSRQSNERRDKAVDKFRRGVTQVLFNVNIMTYGVDIPDIDCIVNARRTRSLVMWLQMLGRGMRVAEGKTECLVLDHGNCTRDLCKATDLIRYRLDKKKAATRNWSRDDRSKEADQSKTYECKGTACGYLFSGTRICPKCGWEVPIKKKDVDVKEANLVRISGKLVEPLPDGFPTHENFFRMLKHHANEKRYSFGWVLKKFEKKAGAVPPKQWNPFSPIPPCARVKNWINKEAQNYARRKSYGRKKQVRKTDGGDGRQAGTSDMFSGSPR